MKVALTPVLQEDFDFLFDFLSSRLPDVNISHKSMPSYEQHCEFVKNHPYRVWFIINYKFKKVGSIYLTNRNEIGVHILPEYWRKGIASESVREIIKMYGDRNYYFNVSPNNSRGIAFVKSFTTKHIHNTYELESR